MSLEHSFLKDKISSGNISIQGPIMWKFLHISSLNYPENPTEEYKNGWKSFINSMPYLIVCKNCSKHASEYISKSNLDNIVNSRDNLFNFFVEFHNFVNSRTKKVLISLEQAKEMYQYGYVKSNKKTIVFLVLCLIVLYLIYKSKCKK